MRKILTVVLLLCLIIFIFNKSVLAVSTTIDNFTLPISADPFTVNVLISSASAGINYLKIDLYKISATNYFGDTFNGSVWSTTGDYTQYFPVTIQSGVNWSGQVQGRIGNPTLLQYDGLGSYRMRIRRYTSSGSYNSTEANNSSIDIVVSVPTLTPIPTLTLVTIAPTDAVPTESTTPTKDAPQPTPSSFDKIYISEVMVNPANGEKEWIEIYNQNDFPVFLDNWYIDDIENGGSPPKIFSLNIAKNNYASFDLTSSMFNNTGDSVRLLDFSKNLKDSFEYGQSQSGKSFGRTLLDSDDFCLQEPTRNTNNFDCINPTPEPTITLICSGYPCIFPTAMNIHSQITTPLIKTIPTPIMIGQISLTQIPTSSPDSPAGDVLGAATKISLPASNLIKLLTFLSSSYSLLTIISILFKMKLNHGKNKKLYSPSFHPA